MVNKLLKLTDHIESMLAIVDNWCKRHALLRRVRSERNKLAWLTLALVLAYAAFNPHQFSSWWLTRDQQGQLLFQFKQYQHAASKFSNSRWQAYSLYGAQEFDKAAIIYSQYTDLDDMLARANAMAHAQRYVEARQVYTAILEQQATHLGAQHNLKIVQDIIDSINLMSESQQPEEGDSPKELGDEPQRAEGAEKKEARQVEIETMSAEQLLNDAKLNEMWLRQVQKNPARFLSNKFQSQLTNQQVTKPSISTSSGAEETENE
ncbi:hypothetical protein [Thalassotalea sp. Y01]|uniref:hypothetical protein n=1 Tax=Thalassotalea sp. Y01 TaxID=2729613 RepID=UPI00145E308E|nr:hypothetical protein [Thalassotalea sp. Y01]NMP15330.1 hypothetical protein [Thalassotalea sp. Y01]